MLILTNSIHKPGQSSRVKEEALAPKDQITQT